MTLSSSAAQCSPSTILYFPDKLQIVKLSEHAIIPTRGSPLAAGYDLYSAYDYVLPARGKILAKTDIKIDVPCGTYGRIAPRSNLAWMKHIDIGAGVVDKDYRGNVGVVMFNHSDADLCIKAGDRIAQLICEKIAYPEIVLLQSLDETERGDRGFGSTETN
jgi:dUTP pyrophosphatase